MQSEVGYMLTVAKQLFENKIDHTTYFGSNTEYIEGIHMLPLMPFSTLTRTQEFVREEWNQYFANGTVDSVVGGWRGVLYANLAIIDAVTSYKFFSNTSFDYGLLDGGASLTWYLTYSAALGGSPAVASTRKRGMQRFERVVGTPTANTAADTVGKTKTLDEKEYANEEKRAAGSKREGGENLVSRFFQKLAKM